MRVLVCAIVMLATCTVHSQFVANQASPPDGPPESAAQISKSVSFGSAGLILSTHDRRYKLTVHGYIQGDDRLFFESPTGEVYDKSLFRRIRPNFEGTVFHVLDFRFMPDFGQSNYQIQDAYIELNAFRAAKPRIGKAKTPIGLEVLKSDRDLIFAERSMVSDLVPLRELGAQISGSILGDNANYAVGYFNGTPDGSNGAFTQWRDSREGVMRIFGRPFAKIAPRTFGQLGVGIAGSLGSESGPLPSFKTVGQSTFFKYSKTAFADGRHDRIMPQAYYYCGPAGLLSEYVISSQGVQDGAVSRTLTNEAWQTTASVMMTGERNAYSSVQPARTFEPQKGVRHLGAVELALRYSQIRIDAQAFTTFASSQTSAHEASEVGLGLNWYLNRYVKLTTDYEHTVFKMSASGATQLHSEEVLMNRVQLAF
jgi:phosphate-selective porin OprO/OprP